MRARSRTLESRRTRSEQYEVTRYGLSRLWSYAPPWATWAGLPAGGLVLHAFASSSPAAGVAVGALAGVGGLGLAAFSYHVFRPRGESVRLHAAGSVAAAGLWEVWVTADGLFRSVPLHFPHLLDWVHRTVNWAPWGAWILAGPMACASWSLRRAARGEGNDRHDQGGDLMEKLGIAGRPKGKAVLEAGGTRVRQRIQLDPTEQTGEDVQQLRGRIAGVTGIRRTGVRIIEEPEDPSQVDVILVPRDQLKEPAPWPGPYAAGKSVTLPIPVGRYEDGDTAQLWLPGDPATHRNAAHYGIMGMSGAGKSESALVTCAEIITRHDASLVFSDPVKGLQTVAPIAAGVDLLLTDQPSAVAGMKALRNVIRARTNFLGQHGYTQWVEGCGLKLLVYWLEESAALVSGSEAFVQLTEQARSGGIILVMSQQRFTHDRFPTSARANMGGGWCFGIRDEDDAGFALSDSTIDAGASPWTWKNTKPGYSYLEAPGVDEARWPVPLRGYLADRDHLREVVAEYPAAGLDEVTAAAFGDVYANYRRDVAAGRTAWQAIGAHRPRLVQVPATTPTSSAPDEDVDEVLDDDEDLDDAMYPHEVPSSPEPDLDPDIDPERPIPEDDSERANRIEFRPPVIQAPKPSPDEARRALRRHLDAMRARGVDRVTTDQLVELRQRVQRSPSWLSRELARLVSEGVLVSAPDVGAYTFEGAHEDASVPA